jgi:hypothetical protein
MNRSDQKPEKTPSRWPGPVRTAALLSAVASLAGPALAQAPAAGQPPALQTAPPSPPSAARPAGPTGRAATGCVLALLDPEDGRVLARVPFNGLERAFEVSFAHPLLGTPVHDEYRVDGDALVLVAERTEGPRDTEGTLRAEGAAGDTERRGTRQLLYRQVPKLLVRTTAQQRARLVLDGERPLTRYAVAQIELRPVGCATPPAR